MEFATIHMELAWRIRSDGLQKPEQPASVQRPADVLHRQAGIRTCAGASFSSGFLWVGETSQVLLARVDPFKKSCLMGCCNWKG